MPAPWQESDRLAELPVGLLRYLSDVSAVLGLDGPAIELFAATDRARELATEDFDLALDLDRKGGPLLLASRGERIFEFDGLGATGERLVDQFRSVLARP